MLIIQDPTNKQSTYLLESLLDSFQTAERVSGAFAFASSAGIRLLTEDKAFANMASKYPVDLIVGIDAVTNSSALDSLAALCTAYPKLKAMAFINPKKGTLFHPKFCWTKNRLGGNLIAGSGNLTESGLLGNWEAYSIESLDIAGIAAVELEWNNWVEKHRASLMPLDNSEVRKRASENNLMAPEGDYPTLFAPATSSETAVDVIVTQFLPNTAEVLIAEIPQSGNRWKQVNFHLDDYQNFFGIQAGVARLLVFRHVNADGSMAAYERSRPPVIVKSRNFRFELAAAAGRVYPDPAHGRPIGVYVRVATRTFFYRLLLPSDSQYHTVSNLLSRRVGPAAVKKMRRVRLSVADLRKEWPNAPFWNLQATV